MQPDSFTKTQLPQHKGGVPACFLTGWRMDQSKKEPRATSTLRGSAAHEGSEKRD